MKDPEKIYLPIYGMPPVIGQLYEIGREFHGSMHQEPFEDTRVTYREGMKLYICGPAPIRLDAPVVWRNFSATCYTGDLVDVESWKEDNGEEASGS